MTVTPNEAATRKTLFWFPNFPALETEKVALVGKILVKYKFTYIVNSSVVSLDITVMILILKGIKKPSLEKMLKQ